MTNDTCSIEGCDRELGQRSGDGLCRLHYTRLVNNGSPHAKFAPRVCEECGQTYSPTAGMQKRCSRECLAAHRAKYLVDWHAERPGYQKERSRKYQQDNAERLNENARIYYQNHKEEAVETQRRWREANPERVALHRARYNEKQKARRRENKLPKKERKTRKTPEGLAEENHRRRAAKLGCDVYPVSYRDYMRILDRCGNACAYCRTAFTDTEQRTWDHVVPLSRGGAHSVGNLLPACESCNTSKWASTLTEWRRRLAKRAALLSRNLAA